MTDQAEPVHPVETETRHLFMATFTVEIEPNNVTARQLDETIRPAGFAPVAA